MKLADFDYELPKELIAQYPLEDRASCRLMVVDRADESIREFRFSRIADFLAKNDLLALNNTKVLTCRLKGHRLSGGKVEVFLLSRKSGLTFEALLKPGRLKLGEKIVFKNKDIFCSISGRNEVTFLDCDEEQVYNLGVIPLPPYIKREPEELDKLYYQTVYASKKGSVASPTAGLHFTEGLLDKIKAGGVELGYVTLHVGHATFKPVKCEDITQHPMSTEHFSIPDETLVLLDKCRKNNGRICAVGTTSCRALETYAGQGMAQGDTSLFIYPGYKFRMVDRLLTNFHLPKTTLFMLVCAFAGEELAKRAYRKAVEDKFRFYSYGDAMLIL
ncbi:MAG: tRNA preQ1(34) S-adenosylmethionine ribosyltransferase-isomerase QueA [Candidatus Omnitrophica bacterium]|jgi:S-adenosylmethionine:tRNA ribosyltransferase-isomerase|nr:tRNA preQ1(34) S-adenosylmethionine ribosyltransferase-isomerase QueA [Candidatus Omnitrophota bacterium]MDD5079470.1 tRNA preQ1(34) S-adenosylmethionine ribosyltransferase-isomerase QueA [Candidatus Omnitrophota bacterium]